MKHLNFKRLLAVSVVATGVASVQADTSKGDLIAKVQVKQKRHRISEPTDDNAALAKALNLAKAGKYKEASTRLFQLSFSPRFREHRTQIQYILGLMLYQMKLYQTSAFQFISVVKQGNTKYLKQSLEKLSLAADALGDDTLLNYAISKVNIEEFPRIHRDMLYFRIGEYQMRNQQYGEAAKNFSRVQSSSTLFSRAKYSAGLAFAEAGQLSPALAAFEDLIDARRRYPVTDPSRVAALMGKARVLYQKKDWDSAIEAYREVPKDTESWHDTLFESSWAMLRSGKFRSALSNFQSLHSPYYEDFYLPESLLLRAIVYLYICKYEEMEKVLNLYQRIYKPVYQKIDQVLASSPDPDALFNEVVAMIRDLKKSDDQKLSSRSRLPLLVVRHITKESDFQISYSYIKKLLEERKRISQMPPDWRNSGIGKYASRVVQTRLVKARARAGRQIKVHLENIKEDLFDLFEQEGFIRYEMINGRKESVKKRLAGKDLPDDQVNENDERDYYVQNGYEYWPFSGEYWLDELGNYHYVGTQSCE